MVENTIKRVRASKIPIISNLLLILLFVRVLFGNSFSIIYDNSVFTLDNSWIYAMNHFEEMGSILGHNLFFTYGPLGFLLYPLDGNIVFTILFLSFLFIYDLIILNKFFFSDDSVLDVLFVVLIILGTQTTSAFIIFSVFLFSIAALKSRKRLFNYILLSVFAAFMSFVKFDISVVCLMFMLAVLFCSFCNDVIYDVIDKRFGLKDIGSCFNSHGERKIFFSYILGTISFPLSCVIIYLIYNPSLSDCLKYYKGMSILSSGYSSSMVRSNPNLLFIIIHILILLLILIFILFDFSKKIINYYFIICFIPCLYGYKSVVVRSDPEHFDISSSIVFVSLILTLYLFLSSYKKLNRIESHLSTFTKRFLCVSLAVISLLQLVFASNFGFQNKVLVKIRLPNDIRAAISDETVTAYPWDILWDAGEDLNYVNYPSLQSYVAFDPYLDNMNADFFSGENAPEYIIYEFKSIDARLFPWEAPMTYSAIWTHYEYTGIDHDYNGRHIYLLKHTDDCTQYESCIVSSYSDDISNLIDLNVSDSYRTISFNIEANIFYKLKSIFYRPEPLFIMTEFDDGEREFHRILLSHMSSELPLDYWDPEHGDRHIVKIYIYSNDIDLIEQDISYCIYEYSH